MIFGRGFLNYGFFSISLPIMTFLFSTGISFLKIGGFDPENPLDFFGKSLIKWNKNGAFGIKLKKEDCGRLCKKIKSSS